MKKFSFNVYKADSLTACAKIIVDLHIGAVVKVKLRRKAMLPLLAMCVVFMHVVENRHLIMLDEN